MRVVGVDFGQRRVGLAISDDTALVARAWRAVPAGATPAESAAAVAAVVKEASLGELGPVGAIVVGLPRRLNGEDTDQTQPARVFAEALGARTGLAVHLQDERLSSHEAETRLAAHERDWRRRKALIDAEAAAVILQDYLDARRRAAGADA